MAQGGVQPAIAKVPQRLRGKLAPAELFHEILEHRWLLSERRNTEVSTDEATEDYVQTVLSDRTEEFNVLPRLDPVDDDPDA